VLPFFALALPVIVLFCGLSLDVGLLEYKKLQMQSAADAGAVGAELEWERNTGNQITSGQQDASVNGFTNGVNGVTVSVVQGPTSGTYAGFKDAVQVTISQSVKTIFMGTLNGGSMTVSASAVAIFPPCGVFTGLSGLTAITVNLNLSNLVAGCPLYMNQNGSANLGSTLTAVAENITGSASQSLALLGTVTVSPRFNAATMTDPLASVTAPTFSACTNTNYTAFLTVATINPGTYCGGITITTSTVTFNPGLYIITGGAHWTGAVVKGTGVTLYFTKGGGSSYGQLLISTASTITLSAPTSNANGGIPGILVFGDRNWIASSPQDFQCGLSSITGDGIWYTTNTGLLFSACPISGTNYLAFDTDNLSTLGFPGITLSSNFSNLSGGNPFRNQAVLVQ
jgi:Putative Flp pilus-assembly TadE/G-like